MLVLNYNIKCFIKYLKYYAKIGTETKKILVFNLILIWYRFHIFLDFEKSKLTGVTIIFIYSFFSVSTL